MTNQTTRRWPMKELVTMDGFRFADGGHRILVRRDADRDLVRGAALEMDPKADVHDYGKVDDPGNPRDGWWMMGVNPPRYRGREDSGWLIRFRKKLIEKGLIRDEVDMVEVLRSKRSQDGSVYLTKAEVDGLVHEQTAKKAAPESPKTDEERLADWERRFSDPDELLVCGDGQGAEGGRELGGGSLRPAARGSRPEHHAGAGKQGAYVDAE